MTARHLVPTALAVGLLAAGCGPAKLDVTKSYELPGGDPREILLDPQPQAQTITVEYEAGAELAVGVFKSEGIKDGMLVDKGARLAADTGQKSGTVVAEVPPNTPATVLIECIRGKTTAAVHITNRK